MPFALFSKSAALSLTLTGLLVASMTTSGPIRAESSTADAVNERIPVSPAMLEAHWGVDCNAAWQQLETASDCSSADTLLRDIKLCAAIYQPPAEKAHLDCRDFRAALSVTGQLSEGASCQSTLRALLPITNACQP